MGLVLVELVMAVEERFGVPIPDQETQHLKTPRQLVDFVAKRVATGRPAELRVDDWSYEQVQEVVFELIREIAGLSTFDPDAEFVRDLRLD